MTEEESSAMPENTVQPEAEQTPEVTAVETPAQTQNPPAQRNILQLIILAAILIFGNYIVYQSYKVAIMAMQAQPMALPICLTLQNKTQAMRRI